MGEIDTGIIVLQGGHDYGRETESCSCRLRWDRIITLTWVSPAPGCRIDGCV